MAFNISKDVWISVSIMKLYNSIIKLYYNSIIELYVFYYIPFRICFLLHPFLTQLEWDWFFNIFIKCISKISLLKDDLKAFNNFKNKQQV